MHGSATVVRRRLKSLENRRTVGWAVDPRGTAPARVVTPSAHFCDHLLQLPRIGDRRRESLRPASRCAIASSFSMKRKVFSSSATSRCRASGLRRQLALDRASVVGQLLQQVGRDGQQVAAGEFEDLRGVAEARAHDLGLVAELACSSCRCAVTDCTPGSSAPG